MDINDAIPDDIMGLAEEAYQQGIYMTSEDTPQAIVRILAKAIMAERERCANLAFDDGKTYGGQGADWLAGHMHARHTISKAIRGEHQ